MNPQRSLLPRAIISPPLLLPTQRKLTSNMYPKVNESNIEVVSSNYPDYEADFDFETESSVHSKLDCPVSYSDLEDSIYSGPLMAPNSSPSQEFVIATFESPINTEFQQEIQAVSNCPALDRIQAESETSILEIAIRSMLC